jgi:hypothetical protein
MGRSLLLACAKGLLVHANRTVRLPVEERNSPLSFYFPLRFGGRVKRVTTRGRKAPEPTHMKTARGECALALLRRARLLAFRWPQPAVSFLLCS